MQPQTQRNPIVAANPVCKNCHTLHSLAKKFRFVPFEFTLQQTETVQSVKTSQRPGEIDVVFPHHKSRTLVRKGPRGSTKKKYVIEIEIITSNFNRP